MISLLGMHRSGTSALAGALHKLGVDLGPEASWISPASDNPLGFFEYQPVVDTNRDILSALGGTWSSPPALPEGWIDDDRLAEQRERAQQLAATLPLHMMVKDPRLSLLQPLWDDVSPPGPALLCVRHPTAVAASLAARNGLTIDQGLHLWFRYNAASMINRPDALVTEYEQLLQDPDTELVRIAAHIGHEVTPVTVRAATMSFRESMSHHDPDQLPGSPIGEICSALYDLLQTAQPLDARPEVRLWARLTTEMPWPTASDREIARLGEAGRYSRLEADRLRSQLSHLNQRARRLETELRLALSTVDRGVIAGTADLLGPTKADAT